MTTTRQFKSYLAIMGGLGLFGGVALAVQESDSAASAAPVEVGTWPESLDADPESTIDPSSMGETDTSTSRSVDPQWVAEAIADIEDNLQELRA